MGKVLSFIDRSGSFVVYLGNATDLVEEGRKIHDTWPVATAALGRVLTGTAMMGLLLKGKENKVTTIFKGDGPAKQVLATANGEGEVKGYISDGCIDIPNREDGHLNVGLAIGYGSLTVVKDLGLKEPYIGKVDLVSGEVAEDLTSYYYLSEQQRNSIALGVKVKRDGSVLCSGGMFIQVLPNASEEAISKLEEVVGEMKPLTTYIEEGILKSGGRSEEWILHEVAKSIFKNIPEEFALEPLGSYNIGWKCDCSKERLSRALSTIGKKDLEEIIAEDKGAELECQFCRKKYHFSEEELIDILRKM